MDNPLKNKHLWTIIGFLVLLCTPSGIFLIFTVCKTTVSVICLLCNILRDRIFALINHFLGVLCGAAERRLLNNLMEYYQKLERPVANESEAVNLKFGFTLQQIMDVS